MKIKTIGLMSGTSLDGLDICIAQFEKTENNWNFQILEAETIAYSEKWENKLRNAVSLSSEDLLALHADYGFYLGKTVKDFLNSKKIKNVDLIASHGHTVFHQPKRKFTLQIGDGRAIKLETSIPTIYDFRSQDVLMGGNGAPLVPIGDELLFSNYDACLNLGGFSNISFKKNDKRIAFDICPVNIILNQLSLEFGKKYDENGNLARTGTINSELLQQLNSLEFYQQQPPKSLGIEWCFENIFPLLKKYDAKTSIATITEHAAYQISKVFNENQLKNVLFTGGGTYNQFLIERIQAHTSTEIMIPSKEIINFKEALIFAFMGVLRQNNEINVLSSATGSSKDHSSGVIA